MPKIKNHYSILAEGLLSCSTDIFMLDYYKFIKE